jgi:hypothetical protein
MDVAAMWRTPHLSDLLWLLTTGTGTTRNAPTSVLTGVAAAALCDLEQIGEVAWAGQSEAATVNVRGECRCEDPTLRAWHREIAKATDGAALPARFALGPLARRAWRDVAVRLADDQTVNVVPPGRGVGRRTAFAVRDPERVARAQHELAQALEHGTTEDRQHDLVAVAWATGCFDDLFHPHGTEAALTLLDAARQEVEGDTTYERISAACGFTGDS